MTRTALLVVTAFLSACARDADMIPLNDQATALGVPKMDLTLYGTGYGPVTMTMPDGEVLRGHYFLALEGKVATGSAVVVSPRGKVTTANSTAVETPINNPLTLQAVGDRGTTINCQGSAGGTGHGYTVCQTNHGAQYQMIF